MLPVLREVLRRFCLKYKYLFQNKIGCRLMKNFLLEKLELHTFKRSKTKILGTT